MERTETMRGKEEIEMERIENYKQFDKEYDREYMKYQPDYDTGEEYDFSDSY